MIGASASATNRGIARIIAARSAETQRAAELRLEVARQNAADIVWSDFASGYRKRVAMWQVPIAQPYRATSQGIIREICRKHGISHGELCSASRARHLVAARHEVFYRLRLEMKLSFPRIGQLVGGRDHSTVIHGVRAYTSLVSARAA